MNPKYVDQGEPHIKVFEECGELIQAIAKAERFGYNESHPDNFPCHTKPREEWCDMDGQGGFMGHTCGKRKTNMDTIHDEWRDLFMAFASYIVFKEKELDNEC